MSDPEDIVQQQRLLKSCRSTLAVYLDQLAQLGPYAPPHLRTEIRKYREHIRQIKSQLRSKGIEVEDNPIDNEDFLDSDEIPLKTGTVTNLPRPSNRLMGVGFSIILTLVVTSVVIFYLSGQNNVSRQTLQTDNITQVAQMTTPTQPAPTATTPIPSIDTPFTVTPPYNITNTTSLCPVIAATHIVTGYFRVWADKTCAVPNDNNIPRDCTENSTFSLKRMLATINYNRFDNSTLKSYVYSEEIVADDSNNERQAWAIKFFLKVPNSFLSKNPDGVLHKVPDPEQLLLTVPITDSTPYYVNFVQGAIGAKFHVECSQNGVTIISLVGYINSVTLNSNVEKLQ